jgi:signal transduction histidine kinase
MGASDRTYLQTPEQWTHFLSTFVHELRTPIASLRLLADLLAEGPRELPGKPDMRYTANIRQVVQELQGLVGEASELAGLLAGRVQIRPEEVVLEQLVDQAEEVVRPQAWERGIALTDSRDPAVPRLFRTDPDRLRQALTLLLGAAVNHARSEVIFRLDVDEGYLHLVISSDGPAFPEAALQTLFEPFDSAWSSRQRGGRNLALPLANELIRALGGTLHPVNHGGRPTFDVSLPAA